MHPTWPPTLVTTIRRIKTMFAFFSSHRVLGIPLDWPLRFVLLGGLYLLLQSKLGRQRATFLCVVLLLVKEMFDIIAVQDLSHPKPPNWGDLADILSGLAGLASAVLLVRLRCRASHPDSTRGPTHSS